VPNDKNAQWVETVGGDLSAARERMQEIATQSPGSYFVFSGQDHSVLAKTEFKDEPIDQAATI
jgi:hypothetical protein